MQISDKELHANLAKMEKGVPVMLNGKVKVVVDLIGGEQTTAWFTLEELKRHLTKRTVDFRQPSPRKNKIVRGANR